MMRLRVWRRSASTTMLAAALALFCAATGRAAAADAPAVPWPTTGWEGSTPEAEGVASSALADLVDLGAKNDMDSLLVVRHGRIVVEAYYAPFRPGLRHLVNSVTKSVVGTLAGIAVQSGAIASIDEPVLESFRWRTAANSQGTKQAMKIAHLLDMTSGLDWREPLSAAPPETMLQMERSRDWVGFVLDRPMANSPGSTFNYNSGDWHLLSAILARKTGLDTLDYARRTLFGPLGITDAAWRSDPEGIRIGGYGLSLQPRDMAKIGYLYLHHGQWAGQRIVAEAWTDRVFHAPIDMLLGNSPRFRYANGWWTIPEKRAYLAVGFLRQLIIVLPDADIVAVVTGKRNYPFLPLIDALVAAAAAKTALPADAAGNARLAERVRAAAIEKPAPVGPASPLAQGISGKVWRFEPNPIGLRSLMLDLSAAEPRFRADFESPRAEAPRRIEGPIGLDGVSRSHQAGALLLAVKGRWLGDDTFEMVTQSVTEGTVTTAALTFRGREADVAFASNQGFTLRLRAVASD
ncbi:MAG: beta-lactamase family protein [Pseudomonadota bacterium]|nr:beta-lactamase family protein [Pseudomonadota bacterium]